MKTVKVFAPASVANIGCGYDTIGFAVEEIGEYITLTKRTDQQLVIKEIIGANLSKEPTENVATIAIQAFLDHQGSLQGFDVTIEKLFEPGSGLGSSASSAAGAVFAANAVLDYPLPTIELLPFALEGETFASKSVHADNVAPSLLGGFQMIRSYDSLDVIALPDDPSLKVLLIFPRVQIKTSESKQLLPKELPMAVVRDQLAHFGALIHALHTKDHEALSKAIVDFVAEPVRKKLIPMYDDVKQLAMEHGSVGFNISGSGPTMFALFDQGKDISELKDKVKKLYESQSIRCDIHWVGISQEGCKTV